MKLTSLLLLLATTSSLQSLDATDSYLSDITDIAEITDTNREAEAWATCSVIYDFYSEIIATPQTKSTSELLKQQHNGAKAAILMSQLVSMKDDASDEEFKATYKYGQHLMATLPSQKELQIKSEIEMLNLQNKPISSVSNKILNTYKTCQNSLHLQQVYIDLFRELAKSGLIQ